LTWPYTPGCWWRTFASCTPRFNSLLRIITNQLMMLFMRREVIMSANNSTDYNRKHITIHPTGDPVEILPSNPHAIIYGYIL
jgi:hypothetical protein